MKKTLFLSLLSIFSIGLFAQPTATDLWTATGNYDISWYDDAAKAAKVVTLTTAAQLAGVSKLNNNGTATPTEQFADWTIKLGADIDLTAHYWEPIGRFSLAAGFKGNFDGQGHTIKGLYINIASTDLAGAALFAFVSGTSGAGTICTFKNFYIESGSIVSVKNFAAAIIGQARYVGLNFEKVGVGSDFSISCTNLHLGGLIGSAYESTTGLTMSDCFFMATIVNKGNATGLAGKGGLIGSAGLHQGTIVEYPVIMQNCYFAGQITSDIDLVSYFGSLIGSSSNLRQATPTLAFSSGSKNLFYTSNTVSTNVISKAIGKAYAAGDNGIDEIAVSVAKDDIKLAAIIQTLNDGRSQAVWGVVSGVNNGFPVPYMLGLATAINSGHSLASFKASSFNKTILISGTKDGTFVKLINYNGALIKTIRSNGDTQITNLQSGLYIVESCGETQKVVVL